MSEPVTQTVPPRANPRLCERKERIVLVEDDPQDALRIRRELAREPRSPQPFRIEVFSTVAAARERLSSGGVDVVLLDLHLPDSRGIDTVRRIVDCAPEVPIVVFTVSGDEDIALRALQAGAQDYLVKEEVSGPLLRRVIRHAIERQRMSRENDALRREGARAEKLESLGVLAGGVAHDFSNLLTVILANAEVAKRELPATGLASAALEAISVSASLASRLTAQLRVYSGEGSFDVEPMDVSAAIREIEHSLRSTVPPGTELHLSLASDLAAVEADVSQIQQVVLNLVHNAGESLANQTGRIEVATSLQELTAEAIADLSGGDDLEPGSFVRIEVRDTGAGMDEDTLSKIFDPFFTTKFVGRGLGLASVLGIVKRHAGGVQVRSRPGLGSTFQIFLPVSPGEARAPRSEAEDLRGEGRVLVVDDDEAVTEVFERGLPLYGYSVVTANSGPRALQILQEQGDEVDVVVLDLNMPGMDGKEAFAALRRIAPELRVILYSGFDLRQALDQFPGLDGYVQKPLELSGLAAKLEEVLRDADPRAGD
jgi:signal transduction histidine kinase